MRYAFAGTPEFGAQVLRDLVSRGLRPVLVVSQPDRPAGRGRKHTRPPVVDVAASLDLPAVQPADVNDPAVLQALRGAGADTLVVAAFGQLLQGALLESMLCVNVHASLLPAYRGAAPVVRAIMAGEETTGISIMRMTAGLDEGPWALQRSVSVSLWDDAGTVGRALALLGAVGVDQVMEALDDGTARWTEQAGTVSYAHKIDIPDRLFDARLSAARLHDRVRALAPGIGCEARTEAGLSLKVWKSFPRDQGPAGETGRLMVDRGRLFVGCAIGSLEILAVQPAGKRVMRAADFLRGYGTRLHDRLQSPHGAGWGSV